MSEEKTEKKTQRLITKSPCMWSACCALALMGVVVALFYLLNCLQPMAGDDYSYSFIWGKDARVSSLLDVLQSQRLEWRAMNGRILANGLAQYFLIYDKAFFDIANTIALIGLIGSVTWLLAERHLPGKGVAASIFLALFLLGAPVPGQTLLWLDGSCNNLWIALLASVFLVCALSPSRAFQVLAVMLAPFAGSAHEGLSIGLVAFLLAYTLLADKKKLSLLYYLVVILVIAGLIFRFHSPGFHHRIGEEGHDINVLSSIYNNFIVNNRIISSLHKLVVESSPALTTFMISSLMQMGCILFFLFRIRRRSDRQNIMALSFLCASLSQTGALFCSGAIFERAWTGAYFFSLLSLLTYILPAVQKMNIWGRTLLSAVLCSSTIAILVAALPSAIAHREYTEHVISAIRKGQRIITLQPKHREMNQRLWFYDVGAVSNCLYWSNNNIARVHHTDTFSLLCPEELQLVQSIDEATLAKARAGDIISLSDEKMLFMPPLHTQRVRVISTTPKHPEEEGKHLAWPIGERHAVVISIPREDTHARIILDFQNQPTRNIELSEVQLNQLRREGILPAEQVNLHP